MIRSPSPLATQLMIRFVLIGGCLLSAVHSYELYTDWKHHTQHATTQVEHAYQQHRFQLEASANNNTYADTTDLLHDLLAGGGIQYAFLQSPEQRWVAGDFPSSKAYSRTYRFSGLQLTLAVEVATLGQYLQANALGVISSVLVDLLVLSVLIAFLYRTLVGQHLETITDSIHTLRRGNRHRPLSLPRPPKRVPDELDQLVEALRALRKHQHLGQPPHNDTSAAPWDLLEGVSDLIWSLDAQGRWRFLNQRASRQLYGNAPESLINTPFIEMALPQHKTEAQQFLLSLQYAQQAIVYEGVHKRADGGSVRIMFHATPQWNQEGRYIGACGTAYLVNHSRDSYALALRKLIRRIHRKTLNTKREIRRINQIDI